MPQHIQETLEELLTRYVNVMFANVSRATDGDASSEFNSFAVTAGVCIDYCIVTRDARLLFETIYGRFEYAKKQVVCWCWCVGVR